MTNAHVVDNSLNRLLPMPELALPATALVDLVVAVPSARERLFKRCIRFQIRCLSDAVPEAVFSTCSDLRGNCFWIELDIEHVLQIIQIVLTVVLVAEQIPHEWDSRDGAAHCAC